MTFIIYFADFKSSFSTPNIATSISAFAADKIFTAVAAATDVLFTARKQAWKSTLAAQCTDYSSKTAHCQFTKPDCCSTSSVSEAGGC